jgi:hypothetical protein
MFESLNYRGVQVRFLSHAKGAQGQAITVDIPMIWKRHGGRKVIIAPDGGDA